MIDHTVLKPTTTESDVLKVIDEAVEHGFAAVCIPPNYVKMARTALDKRRDADGDTGVKVATVIGFPFGYSNTGAKLAEIEIAIADGADELDVVANISDIKAARWDLLQAEINSIMRASKRDPNAPAWKVQRKDRVVKVIIESGVLTDEEIIHCCAIYGAAGIDYLKTSTGYADKGASAEHVALFRANLPDSVAIKASGGIRDFTKAQAMVAAGATRLGCSAGVAIVMGAKAAGATGGGGGGGEGEDSAGY